MQRNDKLLAICLLMIPMLTLVFATPPAASTSSAPMMVQPTMPWEQPNIYERYGPRLENIHYVLTGTPENSFNALDVGDVDIIDWALSKAWKDTWEAAARTDVKVMGYGGEYGYYLYDVREDRTKPVDGTYSTQGYCLFGDPELVDISLSGEDPYTTTRAAAARRAISHMIDRTWIVSTVMGGLGEPIYIPAPAAHGGFNSPNVQKYPQDFDTARELLDDAGVVDGDSSGWRDMPGNNTEIVLDFFIRYGIPREDAGNRLADDIETELDIHVNRKYGDSTLAKPVVMIDRKMDMYTGGWIFVTFPDHYKDIYSEAGWWPLPSTESPPNYMAYCGPVSASVQFDPLVNDLCDLIVASLDPGELQAACWTLQEHMQKKENVYTIPMVSTAAPKAWRTYKKGTAEVPGNEWQGIVNQTAQGVNNWFTFLNMHTDNEPDSGSVFYGLSYTSISKLNPIYASWYQDWEILDKIYDSLLILDPIDRVTMQPWVASDYRHTKEYDPVQGKSVSVVYFTIRKDVYWQDGQQLDADDVIFTQIEVPQLLAAGGYPTAWWDSNVRDINRIEKIDDFHIRTVFSYSTYFAPIYSGGNIIMPEHVWRPILEDSNPRSPTHFCPDTHLIGSGPYQMEEGDYNPGISADVYSYKPASHGFFQYSPIQTFVIAGETEDSSTYWVGSSYVGNVKIDVKLVNDGKHFPIATSTILNTTAQVLGAVVPADSWVGLQFAYPITGGIGTTYPGIWFNAYTTWTQPPPPGHDDWTEEIVFKITCDGDVIGTNDPDPGKPGHVNNNDAMAVVRNYGPTGGYDYPPADIDWNGAVGLVESLIIMGNYGAAGA